MNKRTLFSIGSSRTSSEVLTKNDFFSGFWSDVFLKASELNSSDLHIEPDRYGLNIRLRVDGVLIKLKQFPERILTAQLVVRLKEICKLDVSVRDEVQDGDFELLKTKSRYRVTLSPTKFGESFVFRIIKDGDIPRLDQLNLSEGAMSDLKAALLHTQGFICVTGPTGSGKSSTLQACLMQLDLKKQKVITIEDPIERIIPGVCQQQITQKVSWAKAIKAAMRQDPDVILVGEIRDLKSAQLAFSAAQTGHLVLSTLHTNNVEGTVDRLISLGVERHLVAENLLYVSAQRLIPTLCNTCKEPSDGKEVGAATYKIGLGCKVCNQTGISGRIPILEYAFKPRPDAIRSFDKSLFQRELKTTLRKELKRLVMSGIADQRAIKAY